MISERQKKMLEISINLIENNLMKILRDKTFLQMSSSNMNLLIWWQKICGKSFGRLFESMNVPTQDSLKSLYQSMHSLEKIGDINTDRIEVMSSKIEKLQAELKKLKEAQSHKAVSDVIKKKTRTTRKKSSSSSTLTQ